MMIRAAYRLAFLCCMIAVASPPVHAQNWRLQPRVQREIQDDIRNLDRQISRATDRRVISSRDARALRQDAKQIQRDLNTFSRNGLDRREVQQLESQINRVHARLKLERRDWSGRR